MSLAWLLGKAGPRAPWLTPSSPTFKEPAQIGSLPFCWRRQAKPHNADLVHRLHIMVMSPQVSWLFFKARAKRPYPSHTGRASNAENSQLAAARRVALKMGRRLVARRLSID